MGLLCGVRMSQCSFVLFHDQHHRGAPICTYRMHTQNSSSLCSLELRCITSPVSALPLPLFPSSPAIPPPPKHITHRVCEGECNALGMAFYNSIATLGGFVGPYMTGYLLQRPNGLWIMCFSTGGFLVLSSGAIVLLRFIVLRRERKAAAAQNGAAGPKGLDSDAVGAAGAVAAGGAVGADVLGANKDIEAPRDLRKDSGPDMMYPPGKGHKQQGGGVGGRDALMHRGKDTNRDLLPTTQAR